MGGLRKKIPWTFWTMVHGHSRHRRTPGFSGFFSKDEILLATQRASTPLWASGRFDRRAHLVLHVSPAVPDVLRRQRFDEKHVHVHESPRNMLAPLVVLAILAVVEDGWPRRISGAARISSSSTSRLCSQTAPETPAAAAEASVGAIELLQALLGAPVIAGLIGFFFAWWFYIRSPKTPKQLAASLAATYKLLSGKYFVDELYAAAIVRPLVWISDKVLWRVVDEGVIDGTVNGVGLSRSVTPPCLARC